MDRLPPIRDLVAPKFKIKFETLMKSLDFPFKLYLRKYIKSDRYLGNCYYSLELLAFQNDIHKFKAINIGCNVNGFNYAQFRDLTKFFEKSKREYDLYEEIKRGI